MTSCRVLSDAAMHSHHLLPFCYLETKPGRYITSFLRHFVSALLGFVDDATLQAAL